MASFTVEKNDWAFYGGVIISVLSFLVFWVPSILHLPVDLQVGIFCVNYALAVLYFSFIWLSGRLRKGRNGLILRIIFLVLSLISCYSLNKQITVFDEPISWFALVQILICINYIGFGFYNHLPISIRNLMMFVLGIAILVFLYMSIYLVPLFFLGVLGLIVLGISFHVFVPVLFVIYTIKLVGAVESTHRHARRYFFAGMGTGIVLLIGYISIWSYSVNKINEANQVKTKQGSSSLPAWINVAQKIPNTILTDKILKSDLVYSIPDLQYSNIFWRLPSRRWNDETTKHDPLIVVAALLAGKPSISEEDKLKILESMYDARHQSEERLWEGTSLVTDLVDTRVDLWPQFSLSYTEKKIVVTNKRPLRGGWRSNDQEAIYTFDLTEGAVVSSLSLWINDKEEKGILTSKQKADSAYRQIVGVQMRDPSVVHWREGNRVSVRVFPVIDGESRIFKIGVTAPLERRGGKMLYRNIQFKGPDFSKAKEVVTVVSQTPVESLIFPALFDRTTGVVRKNQTYQPDWSVTMDEQPVSSQVFSFDGNNYHIRPYDIQRIPTEFQNVFLDLNNSWTNRDFENIWELVKSKNVWVYDSVLTPITEENHIRVFNKLRKNRFSLFPFHLVNDPGSSLVITKNDGFSPNLEDLSGSPFLTSLKTSPLKADDGYCVFSLNQSLSPYLKTLKEYRFFRYETGTIEQLSGLLQQQYFAKNIETENQVVLENSGLAINTEKGSGPSTAPDHLMRLFSYNHILQQQGRTMFSNNTWNEALVKEAQRANIVTPVSSLVVLETQKDYDRFKISNDEISLKNATAKNTGAAPEPHEWALILLGALIVAKLKFPFIFKLKRA